MIFIAALLAYLAVQATHAVDVTCRKPISCPCGDMKKNVTVCVSNDITYDEVCRRLSRCSKCEENSNICENCLVGLDSSLCFYGQFDENFTLENIQARLESDASSLILCYDNASYKITFSRKSDTGQGTKLPKWSDQLVQGKPIFARVLEMPEKDEQNRFGVFQCEIEKGSTTTEIVTMKLPPADIMELDALTPYKVVSVGENINFEVKIMKKLELPIKWMHNDVELPKYYNNQLKIPILNVQLKDAGIYECFYEGRRSEGVHALMRLIVRKCSAGMYGEDCDQKCPTCYNGGICHDRWGVCICPAGFSGLNCEIVCDENHFGADCSKICSSIQNNRSTDETCASHLFCKPDPFGCSCAPGFKGSNCMEHCEPGWYGADCKQPCHCAKGSSSCNRITGACTGGCAIGWLGKSCQIEGKYDVNFTLVSRRGRLESDKYYNSAILCYSDDRVQNIRLSRKLNTGQGTELPKESNLKVSPGVNSFHMYGYTQGKQERFGVFQCEITRGIITTEIVTLKLPPADIAELDALTPYNVASVGETVELEVKIMKKLEQPIKWMHNGVKVPSWNNQLKIVIHEVQPENAGIYECFYERRRRLGVHALMRLIVRNCSAGMYGEDCDQKCPPCYNGGICHDKWGICICPAGFSGLNCEIACGGSDLDVDCNEDCVLYRPENLCASHLLCKPDPYGCSCAPGLKGSDCNEHCEPGWYGADCKQPCHCANGSSSCNRISGACSGGCAEGWLGNSCQIEEIKYCINPGVVLNGRAQYFPPATYQTRDPNPDEYPAQSVLVYTCYEGYRMQGRGSLTCQSTGFWSGNVPTCVPDCGRSSVEMHHKVINGSKMISSDWPWVVSILVDDNGSTSFLCGGVLLNNHTVITAAHCLTGPLVAGGTLIVRFGNPYFKYQDDNDEMLVRNISRVIVHPDYSNILDSDIGLAFFHPKVSYSNRVQPLCLPTGDSTAQNIETGSVGYFGVWAKTEEDISPNMMILTFLPVISNRQCMDAYKEQNLLITSNMFCAGYEDAPQSMCGGDSGFPFVFYDSITNRYTLEGLAIFGTKEQCAVAEKYVIYAKVSRFLDWIIRLS